jgi:hypothetical protein
MRKTVLALAILAVAAPALARDKPAPAATPDGPAVDCVLAGEIRDSAVRNDQVIDFYMRNGKVMRNTLDVGCPQLGSERRFIYRVNTSQLCSSDAISVLLNPRFAHGASCGLGQFQPVKLTKAAK